jgi:hypothetical protein
MASPKETDQSKARRWLKRHRGQIPPRIRIEQGTRVPLGETGRNTPVVKLDEETVGPVNNPYLTDSKPATLHPGLKRRHRCQSPSHGRRGFGKP